MGKTRSLTPIYSVNAKLKTKQNINSPSVYYAVNDGADGYSMVEVSSLPTTELFIGQGTSYQNDITEWTLFNSQETYGGIGANAFAHLINLESITIWQENTDSVLTIDDNAFYGNADLEHIYVHPDLLSAYQSAYSGKSFVSLFEAYALVNEYQIPTSFNGEQAPTTLTNAWILKCIANMPSIERNTKTTIIVPSYFTGVDIGAFNGLGNLFSNITELKCNGGFLNGASWCKHLWLDNGSDTFNGAYVTDDTVLDSNFRTLAPYLVFANYFMSEYPSEYPVIGYQLFSSGDVLPHDSPTGEYLWFSNINFNTDYESPTGLENDPSFVDDYEASSSGYYYCYDKTEILVIQGTGALTSAMVESAILGIDTPLSWITKVVVSSGLTLNTSASAGCLDSCDTYLPNVTTLELNSAIYRQGNNGTSDLYSNWTNSNCKFKNVYYSGNELQSNGFNGCYLEYFESETITSIPYENVFTNSKIIDIKVPNVTEIRNYSFLYSQLGKNDTDILFENVNWLRDMLIFGNCPFKRMFIPKLETINNYALLNSSSYKLFISTNNCSLGGTLGQTYQLPKGLYFKATDITTYIGATNWDFYANYIVGVIDGGDTYANIKNRGVSMGYPKLNGIDTETNIQLLTPSNDVLYLASDTGNLWQYDSANSQWTNLFSGYTPTWYSDEDCTTTISASSITTDMTVYVKLTAI